MAIYIVMNMQTYICKHLYMKHINVTVISCYHYQLVIQLSLTLCNPMDYNPPGSSVYGIQQARRLEWVAIPFPDNLPYPGFKSWSPTLQADSSPSEPPGKPLVVINFCQVNALLNVVKSFYQF